MKTKTILLIIGGVVLVGGGIAAVVYYNKKKKQDSVPASAPSVEGEGVNVNNALDVLKNVLGVIQSVAPLTKSQLSDVTRVLNDSKTDDYKRSEIKNGLKKKGYTARYIQPISNGVVAPMVGVNAGWVVYKG